MAASAANIVITLEKPTTIFGKGDIVWCNLKRLGILPKGTVLEVSPLMMALDHNGEPGGFHACKAQTKRGLVEGYVRSDVVPQPELELA